MIKNNQFTLATKFGNVAVKINANGFFYVSSRLNKESGYGEEEPFNIVIRNKTYNYFSYRVGLNRLWKVQLTSPQTAWTAW